MHLQPLLLQTQVQVHPISVITSNLLLQQPLLPNQAKSIHCSAPSNGSNRSNILVPLFPLSMHYQQEPISQPHLLESWLQVQDLMVQPPCPSMPLLLCSTTTVKMLGTLLAGNWQMQSRLLLQISCDWYIPSPSRDFTRTHVLPAA